MEIARDLAIVIVTAAVIIGFGTDLIRQTPNTACAGGGVTCCCVTTNGGLCCKETAYCGSFIIGCPCKP